VDLVKWMIDYVMQWIVEVKCCFETDVDALFALWI